jgi:hypothetical protein
MPNNFSPRLAVGHRFIFLDNFEHCDLSDGVTHEVCLRLSPGLSAGAFLCPAGNTSGRALF